MPKVEPAIFVERVPRDEAIDRIFIGLGGPAWRVSLAALYLNQCRYMPEDAKRHGCSFGFCDEHGTQRPMDKATHVGWTVSPAPEAPHDN